ncbi:MAG: serine/threonine protein kinase [Waterburya sp.]
MSFIYQSGDIIGDRYIILHQLGQGGNAITYAARDLQTEEQVAIKILSLKKLDNWKKVELFEREAKILQQLEHSAISNYIDYFKVETKSDCFFYIVQQLAPGKSLVTLIESGWQPDETTVKQIAEQILEILIYLQQLVPPVIHRDIKPQNIIRGDDGQIFLVDFGAVQDTYHHTVMGSTVVGTYGYMAPEQFRGQAFLSTDLYGLGTTLLFLLTGQSPTELPEKKLKIDFRNSVKISSGFADWIDKLIEPSHEYRLPSAEAALEVLQGKQSLSSYITQKPPKYTAVSLTKTEDKLIVTIPPALFYKQCDRTILFYTLAWYVVLILMFVGVSASFPILNFWLFVYAFCLIAEILSVDRYAAICRVFQWIIVILFLFPVVLLIVLGSSSLGGEIVLQNIISSYFILLLDRAAIANPRINVTRNLLFTTYLQIYNKQQIKIIRKVFNNNLVDLARQNKPFKIYQLGNALFISIYSNSNDKEIQSYELGRLLTSREKSWLLEEINKFLNK